MLLVHCFAVGLIRVNNVVFQVCTYTFEPFSASAMEVVPIWNDIFMPISKDTFRATHTFEGAMGKTAVVQKWHFEKRAIESLRTHSLILIQYFSTKISLGQIQTYCNIIQCKINRSLKKSKFCKQSLVIHRDSDSWKYHHYPFEACHLTQEVFA